MNSMSENLLISRGTYKKFTPQMVGKLRKAAGDATCFVVVGYDELINDYIEEASCISRENCLRGNYDTYINNNNMIIHSLDSNEITDINTFLSSAMLMNRRFEKRIRMTFSGSLSEHYRIIINHILFWNSFLENNNIKYFVMSDAPHEVYDYIIYELCKKKGICTIGYRSLYKTDRYLLFQDFDDFAIICKRKYEECLVKYEEKDMDYPLLDSDLNAFYNSLKSDMTKTFSSDVDFKREFVYRFGETRLDLYIRDCIKRKKTENSFRETVNYLKTYIYILNRKRETIRFRTNYEALAQTPVFTEPYVYFALHLLPESAAEPLGGVFSDQFWAIKMISEYLPEGWKLFIKIHPAQVCTVMDFEEIKRFANVKNVSVISAKANQQELIRRAKAVATLTGEIAIESMMLDVPCLVFGKTYYGAMPNAKVVESKDDMEDAIDWIKKGDLKIKESEKVLFFKAMEEISYKGIDGAVDEICWRIREKTQ